MKLRSPREVLARPRGKDILLPAAEQEEDSFIPERDVHERDWQIAQIILTEALSKSESSFSHVEGIVNLVRCVELVDPKRVHELVTDAALEAYASTATYNVGSEEQIGRARRKIWSNLKICGIETTPPSSWSELESALDITLAPLHNGRERPGWDIDLTKDVRICLQMFPNRREYILERVEAENFWKTTLDVLRQTNFQDDWGVHFGLELASELCLIDPARAAEVKSILRPHWGTILSILKRTQRIGDGFELFDPKKTLDPENKKKLMSIHTNEIYEGFFFDMAAALAILSAQEAEIDPQGRIKLTRLKERVANSPTLPDRLVA